MRVLVMADSMFASRERPLLSLQEMGLADEGVEVIHAVPEGGPRAPAAPGVFRRMVRYPARTFSLTRGLAVRRIIMDLAALDQEHEPEPVDIVHVFGGNAWRLGITLAEELEAALALELWRHGLTAKLAEVLEDLPSSCAALAPDPVVEHDARRVAPHLKVFLAPWGVLAQTPRAILPTDRSASVMIVGTGRDAARFAAVLAGLAPIVRERGDVMIFCDAAAARRSDLWPIARRLQLLDKLSLVEDLEGRRDLLVQGDLLVHPESSGDQRSVLLEAMARGMVVVAATDRRVSWLVDGVTARLVPDESPSCWERVFRDVFTNVNRARELGLSAHHYVREHRKASAHVRSVMHAYTQLLRAPAAPSPAPAA